MDVQEKRQLDVVAQMARVKARARPWRSIIALVIAIASIVAVKGWGRSLSSAGHTAAEHATGRIIIDSGAAAFCVFGVIAVLGLSGTAGSVLRPVVGSAHAAVVRYALVLVGAIVILLTTLSLLDQSVYRLIVGGALAGVLVGIAAQQSLANVFAGVVLMFARPFSVGDRVRIRAGALAGTIEGTVVEISITYVRLDTSDGLLFLPNSQVLSAAVGPAPSSGPPGALDAGQPAAPAAGQPGTPAPGQPGGPSPGLPGSPVAEQQPGGQARWPVP